ncbi:hypothetical protein F4778DRAFT_482498 [Xylariomycetidae sp. FL2044]|nr:hypothetical protein F4778DRAFT_482498 [Xylariomycetidae sp. FL2044]
MEILCEHLLNDQFDLESPITLGSSSTPAMLSFRSIIAFRRVIAMLIAYSGWERNHGTSSPIPPDITPPERILSTSCRFFGHFDAGSGDTWNEYTISLAGFGNNGESDNANCGRGMDEMVEDHCKTDLLSWQCRQVHENLHDTMVSFRLSKYPLGQPYCVSDIIVHIAPSGFDPHQARCWCNGLCYPREMGSYPGDGSSDELAVVLRG